MVFWICTINSNNKNLVTCDINIQNEMNKKLSIIILLAILSMNVSIACSCAKVSYVFMDRVHRSSFVAMVEVVGKDTIKGFDPSSDYAFTVVKIINQFAGKFVGNEIKIIESKGYECFTGLRYKNIGDRLVVKGSISDVSEYVYRDREKEWPKEDILALSLCATNQLYIDGDYVKGWITKNKWNKWHRWSSLIKRITFGLIERKDKTDKQFELQKIKLDIFLTLLKDKTR